MTYSDERLGQLLALLRAAPAAWVERAQQIPLTELDARELLRKLDTDPDLRQSFDEDPIAAAKAAGMPELAAQLERELAELMTLPEAEIPEVVAHGQARPSLRAQLRALLFRSEAARQRIGSE